MYSYDVAKILIIITNAILRQQCIVHVQRTSFEMAGANFKTGRIIIIL